MYADTLSRVDGSNPETPGLLTASDGQLLQPPTLLPLASVRGLWQFRGTLDPHLLVCWVLAVPDAEGEREGETGACANPTSFPQTWPAGSFAVTTV